MRDPREQLAVSGEAHFVVSPVDLHFAVSPADLEPDQPDAEAVIRKRLSGYTVPAPPPADMPVDLGKWRNLDRKTRRALLRHHRKVTGS